MGKGVQNRKIAVVLDQSPQALCMDSLSIVLTPHQCHHGNIYITMATLVSPSTMYHNFLGFHNFYTQLFQLVGGGESFFNSFFRL